MTSSNPLEAEKDLPLRDDIRLLGRILGDTVREQEGETIFDIVERIRRTSIRFHRDEDDTARRDLEAILDRYPDGITRELRDILARQATAAGSGGIPGSRQY